MNILDVASEDFPLKQVGRGIWAVDTKGAFDSIRIWPETNTWHRFSRGIGGTVRHWLSHIRHYSQDEINEICGQEKVKSTLIEYLEKQNYSNDSNVEFNQIIGAKTYNSYIASRGVTKEVAAKYSIEVSGDNALFPMLDYDGNRIGALVRYAHAKQKGGRYRFYMLNNNPKPYFWPLPVLAQYSSNNVLCIVESTWSTCLLDQYISPHIANLMYGCVLGDDISELLIDNLRYAKVIFLLDDDAGGDFMEGKLIKFMLQNKRLSFEVYRPDKYIDEMSQGEILELFRVIWKSTSFKLEVHK